MRPYIMERVNKMKLNDILELEGIVIRKIPKESVALYSYNDHNKRLLDRPNMELVYIESYKRDMIKETKVNSLGGKYLITTVNNQDSQVRFNLKSDGIGDTIDKAYEDYIGKNK